MITQSRLDFELWAKSKGYDLRRWYDSYYDGDTHKMWLGWSARDDKILELSAKLKQSEEA